MDNTMIDVSDLDVHRAVRKQMQDAQVVWRFWAQYLGTKYALGPQDTISEQGEIQRAQSPKAVA
jgi:hypothetical protein